MNKKNNPWVTAALIAVAIIIAVFPLFLLGTETSDGEETFGGTDDGAETVVEEQDPDYEPWFDSIIGELPGEVESGLFATQAALGAGVVGFALGNYRGRTKAEERLTLGEQTGPTVTTSSV